MATTVDLVLVVVSIQFCARCFSKHYCEIKQLIYYMYNYTGVYVRLNGYVN